VNRTGLALRTIFDCVWIACLLGIALDLVTANVAVEYFTVHHPKVVESKSPFVMALVWGIGAAWWFGAIAGGVLAAVNSRRKSPVSPKVLRAFMIRTVGILWLTMMAMLSSIYGLIGLIPGEKRRPSFDEDRQLMSVALTHMTEYVLGAVALAVVCRLVWKYQSPRTPEAVKS